MSVPPYIPPTEEEFNALHARLSGYIDAFVLVTNAAGVNGESGIHTVNRAVDDIKRMRHRLECLQIAVGS